MSRCLTGVLTLAVALSVAASAQAQGRSAGALLDVPYLPQTPQLCGGAAVAMVLRYWGARDVFPQDFATLVDERAGGIRTSALVGAVGDRGWQPLARQTAGLPYDWLRRQVDRGRPVIALIGVRPDVFHYVVVVGTTADTVVFHDPARAPFHTVARDEFDRAWVLADRWALVVMPPASGVPAPPLAAARPTVAAPLADLSTVTCAEAVSVNVALARAGRLDDAEHGLLTAAARCPGDASVWTELAGLRFVQQRYAESADLARRVLALAPNDTYASQLLATTLYLQGESADALDAWNAIDQPGTDVVVVEGVTRTLHPVIVGHIGLEPRQLLTRATFERTARRLHDLPSAATAALRYRPQNDGSATVHAVITERPLLPRGAMGWAIVGVYAGLRREARLPVTSPLRQGDTWDLRYRWENNRPRVLLTVQAPAPGRLPGLLGVDAFWERQSYAAADAPLREERRRVAVHLSDWASRRVRWQMGAAADRMAENRYLAVQGELETRWFDDHLAVGFETGYWTPTAGGAAFGTGAARLAWRSQPSPYEPLWTLQTGGVTAGEHAPLAIWPVAGSSDSRGALLRGHRLLNRGVIVSDVLGRRLTYATVEHHRPVYAYGASAVAVAGFIDVARAWRRLHPQEARSTEIDVGAGLRLTAPGFDGLLRVDVAYGIRDGRTKLSAGFVAPWGR